jgi:glyoxylase I family protein
MANEVINCTGFHHVALRCKDIQKSIDMYKALGLREKVRWGEGEKLIVLMDIGSDECIEFFANGSDFYSENGKWQHVAFAVEDVDAAFQTAVQAGFVADILPKVVPLDSNPPGVTLNVAFVKGPDGESLEFFKML